MRFPAELIAEVARLVRLTATHDPMRGDRNGEALSGCRPRHPRRADRQIRRAVAAVRGEYAHLSDEVFGAGRARILQALLEQAAVYRTRYARERWEAKARRNLGAELRGYVW